MDVALWSAWERRRRRLGDLSGGDSGGGRVSHKSSRLSKEREREKRERRYWMQTSMVHTNGPLWTVSFHSLPSWLCVMYKCIHVKRKGRGKESQRQYVEKQNDDECAATIQMLSDWRFPQPPKKRRKISFFFSLSFAFHTNRNQDLCGKKENSGNKQAESVSTIYLLTP